MSYRANAGAAPRPMNPPILSSRPAQPASHHSPTPSSSAGKTSPVLVRQPQPSSFESQPTTQPRPAPQPPALSSASSQGPAHGQAQAQGQRPPPLSLEESKQVARTHHSALKRWLAEEGALNSGSTRTNAREKLTRLTRQQFQELSTDVYDELVRRLQDSGEGQQGQHGFLAVRPDFHPKRNQARQKLATLPITRFRDLGSDVYFELDRRYPEFNEEGETVEPLRSPTANQGFQQQQQQQQQQQYRAEQAARGSPQLSRDGSLASSHSHSLSGAGQQQYHAMRQNSPSPSPAPPANLNAQRRAPTPTSTGTSSPVPTSSTLPPAVPLIPAAAGAAASGSIATPTSNDVVVPNKSTMRVEEPPRAGTGPAAGGAESPPPSATSSHHAAGTFSTPPTTTAQAGPSSNAAATPSALARSGSSTSNQFSLPPPQSQSQQQDYSPSPASSRQFPSNTATASPSPSRPAAQPQQSQSQSQAPSPGFTHRASEASSTGMMSRFVGAYGAGGSQYAASQAGMSEAGRGSWDQNQASSSEQVEQVRASYEYKLTMLQNRIAELENAAPRADSVEHKERLRMLEETHLQQLDEHERRIRTLQEENSSLRSMQSTPAMSHTASGHSRADSQFRARLHEAEELASELRGEVSALVDEVRSANERADELQAEVEREREEKEKVQQEATAWKERYQQAKVELRNIKATSQLFTSSISPDADFMPASADGLVSDTAVGTFQTSIDDLLQAARSKEPSNVFNAAHAVVRACEALDNDVQAIPPSRLASFPPKEQEHISTLKGNINATLSNLMTASKNHATSFGVLPVSLVDAAASHLAQAVVELVRVLKIRRTAGSGPSTPQRNGFSHNDPMPPLPENAAAQIAQRSDSLSQRGQTPQQQQAQSPPGKAQGYFSGGLSSVKHALETFGLSSPTHSGTSQGRGELPSSRSIEDRLATAGGGEPQSGFSTSSAQSHQQSYSSHSSSAPDGLYSPPASQRQVDHSSFSTATSVSSPPHAYRTDEHFGQGNAPPPVPARNDERSEWHREQHEQRSGMPGSAAQDPYGGRPEHQFGYNNQQQQSQLYGQQGMSPRAPYDAVPSPTIGGQERAPEELRAYVENQTELIVHSIQSLLSAIRSGASASELNDSLNQIITIVSSIVGISQQALPATDAEADVVLQDLTTHCDKLSVMQSTAVGAADGLGNGATPTFTKQTKQAMAAASFGVAKSLKHLNGLLNGSSSSNDGGAPPSQGPDSLT